MVLETPKNTFAQHNVAVEADAPKKKRKRTRKRKRKQKTENENKNKNSSKLKTTKEKEKSLFSLNGDWKGRTSILSSGCLVFLEGLNTMIKTIANQSKLWSDNLTYEIGFWKKG